MSSAQEPQFKFYLAFEDAKQERDTVWFIIDDSATGGLDTVFGEDSVQLDSSKFQVFFGYQYHFKTYAAPIGAGGTLTGYVRASNAQYPIIVHWDTTSLVENDLPFPITLAKISTQSFQVQDFQLFKNEQCPGCDSLILDSFMIGGGWGEHFPIKVFFFKGWNYGIDGLSSANGMSIYPNPAGESISIGLDAIPHSAGNYSITDVTGNVLKTGRWNEGGIDVRELVAGYYILSLTTPKHQYHEIFSKN